MAAFVDNNIEYGKHQFDAELALAGATHVIDWTIAFRAKNNTGTTVAGTYLPS